MEKECCRLHHWELLFPEEDCAPHYILANLLQLAAHFPLGGGVSTVPVPGSYSHGIKGGCSMRLHGIEVEILIVLLGC